MFTIIKGIWVILLFGTSTLNSIKYEKKLIVFDLDLSQIFRCIISKWDERLKFNYKIFNNIINPLFKKLKMS